MLMVGDEEGTLLLTSALSSVVFKSDAGARYYSKPTLQTLQPGIRHWHWSEGPQ